MILVLDTNVCVDLFVFKDARWAALRAALEDGRIKAFTRSDCRREWQIVLTYPHLPIPDEASRTEAAAHYDRLLACLQKDDFVAPEPRLPVCKDGDDQKFLETAHQAKAAVLVTKDKALLKLAKRNAKLGYFRIQTPEAWHADWNAALG